MANIISDQIDALNAQIDDLQQQLLQHQASATSYRQRAAQWQAKYDGTARNRRDEGDLDIVRQAQADAARHEALAREVQARIDAAKASLKRLETEQANYNAALANAAGKGLVGEAAEAAALAEVERAKTTRNLLTIGGIALLIVLLIVLLYWYRKRKR